MVCISGLKAWIGSNRGCINSPPMNPGPFGALGQNYALPIHHESYQTIVYLSFLRCLPYRVVCTEIGGAGLAVTSIGMFLPL